MFRPGELPRRRGEDAHDGAGVPGGRGRRTAAVPLFDGLPAQDGSEGGCRGFIQRLFSYLVTPGAMAANLLAVLRADAPTFWDG